jgi:hypothetical protein
MYGNPSTNSKTLRAEEEVKNYFIKLYSGTNLKKVRVALMPICHDKVASTLQYHTAAC